MKSKPNILTLDMGTFSTKIIEGLDREDGVLEVIKYGIFSSLHIDMQNGNFINKAEYAKQLKQIHKEHFFHVDDSRCCFTCPSIYSKDFILPEMKQNELRMNIALELPSFLPEPVSQFHYDYKISEMVDSVNQKGYKVIVYALPRQWALDCQWVLQHAGFKGKMIDIIPNICEKLYRRLSLTKLKDETCVALIDVGYSIVSVTILENGKLKLYRSIPLGVGEDNDTIPLNEKWVHIQHDIQRIFEYYSAYVSLSNRKPDCSYIMGSGSLIPVFWNQLQEKLKCPVEGVEKLLESDAVKIKADSPTDVPLLFHSLGLLIREDQDR